MANTTYSFGTMKLLGVEKEVVRVKSDEPIQLSTGYSAIVENYPDMIVTHNFYAQDCVAEDRDTEGNYYKWYLITEHSKNVDRSPAAVRLAKQNAANLEYVCMMADIELPEEV